MVDQFHIGFNNAAFVVEDEPTNGQAANIVKMTTMSFLSNAHMMSDLIVSGLCHRFPRLNFVSVESGAGYIPSSWIRWTGSGRTPAYP